MTNRQTHQDQSQENRESHLSAARGSGYENGQRGDAGAQKNRTRAAATAPDITAIAAIAPSLKEAELRLLIFLAASRGESRTVCASSREIAAKTHCSRNKIQAAIDTLTDREIIATHGGGATQAATYTLHFLDVLQMTGSEAEPPANEGGNLAEPQVATERGQGGSQTEPAPPENKGPEFPPTALLIERTQIEILNRVLSKNSTGGNRAELQHWRELVTHVTRKLCGRIPWHVPNVGLDTVAKIAEACDSRQECFEAIVFQLQTSSVNKMHESPMWWVYVCLQRAQGIAPQHTRQRMAELAAARRPRKVQPWQERRAEYLKNAGREEPKIFSPSGIASAPANAPAAAIAPTISQAITQADVDEAIRLRDKIAAAAAYGGGGGFASQRKPAEQRSTT